MSMKRAVVSIVLTLTCSQAFAAIIEETISLPVAVRDASGSQVRQSITVTVFRDDARPKSPFLVLNHGRAGDAAGRAALGRARYTANSRYFVSKGFVVLAPTRIGYGMTGGPDVENSGRCASRNFPPVFEAAAQQVIATIQYAKTLPYVDGAKGLVVGQSVGGATAIAVAAKNVSGVVGVVNFAGGSGGRPESHPGDPCSPEALGRTLASYGARAKSPTLWLYSENDKYWGKDLPRAWFAGFVRSGGKGKFIQLRPSGDDGHSSFSREPEAWKPAFENFLNDAGLGRALRNRGAEYESSPPFSLDLTL
jgi:dienelactone hydrolase